MPAGQLYIKTGKTVSATSAGTAAGAAAVTARYLVSASHTSATPCAWSPSVPSLSLWASETLDYAGGGVFHTTARCVVNPIAKAIADITCHCLATLAVYPGAQVPDKADGSHGTWQTSGATLTEGQHLWCYYTILYSDGTGEETQPVHVADYGDVSGEPESQAGGAFSGYVDAYLRYGLSLADGAINSLITPAPNKQPVGNKNAVTAGAAYLRGSVNVKDERSFTLEVHFRASTEADFMTKYARFCDEVLNLSTGDHIRLKTSYFPNEVYHLVYQDCQQFSQFRMRLAKFNLSLLEPHPEMRT